MNKKQLLACWKYLRGSHDGYLLSSIETWKLMQETIFYRDLTVYERIIRAAYESQYCKQHDC